ncbi:MAG TPA: hypothetical protein VMG41_01955 [Gemmatimonadales bacterium]|nr:hypothetical protein [Gemmatimonadales bacterium]
MTKLSQDEKRRRAAALPSPSGANPSCGPLDVSWDSAFDRMCYMVSAPDLAVRNARRYQKLMAEAMEATGCTEEEIIAHGNKVRAVLFFAQDRLTKQGALAGLAGKQKYAYRLPPVSPMF